MLGIEVYFAERAMVAPRLHSSAVRHRRRSHPQVGELIRARSFADAAGPKMATLGTKVLATEKRACPIASNGLRDE